MIRKFIMTIVVYIGGILLNYAMVSKGSDATVISHVAYVTQPIFADEVMYKNVKATVYHAVAEQTDNTPFLTADNSFIDTSRVNSLRWIAVSRDLLKLKTRRYNFKGKIKLGDTIWISYDKRDVIKTARERKIPVNSLLKKYDQIVGWWVVKDTMGDYYWKSTSKSTNKIDSAMLNSKEYKIDKGIVYQRYYQRNWIDFLQHPKTGMLEYWNKSIIITKKRLVGHNTELVNVF